MNDILRRYFRAWVDADIDTVRELFSDDIVYSECWGPEYRGIGQITRWFEDWNKKGRVLEWRIKRTVEQGDTLVAEWYFECEYEGNTDGFDGVTIADLDNDGRICRLSEFQSKAEHIFPYEE